MDNIFYEESGRFKTAVIVQKNDATYLVDTPHGKRAKVKAGHVFLTFPGDGADFLQKAEEMAAEVDTDLLWSVCGEDEFTAAAAAEEYFGGKPKPLELAATLVALYAAPMYFYKKSKGVFKAAPEETLKQALAAAERKKEQEAQIAAWTEELAAGKLPEAVAADIRQLLYEPDKQSLTYKAASKAAAQKKLSLFALLQEAGAVPDLPEYFLDGFLWKHFPAGVTGKPIPDPEIPDLPAADSDVHAFSIDDASTTEIDDALSVRLLPGGNRLVGIHIAVPAPAVSPDSLAEKRITDRQSTVYYPGGKITMLPDNWISAFSLDAGDSRPALSLYAEVDPEFNVVGVQTRVESVFIDHNLRIGDIETLFRPDLPEAPAENFPHREDMDYLYAFAVAALKARGKYEPDRPKQFDYGIDFGEAGEVRISVRERGAPIDMLVSEMMILANSTWAKMLDDAEIPGIFRVQPAGKVRMSTRAEPHIGMGVQHYGWFTSPLRRAADYINQKQLLSLVDPETYPPRFEKDDEMLFAALRDFEAAYSAYAAFQRHMEAYWSLIWLEHHDVRELTAVILKEDLVRIEGLPLTTRVTGVPIDAMPRSRIRVNVTGTDLMQVSASLTYAGALAPAVPATS